MFRHVLFGRREDLSDADVAVIAREMLAIYAESHSLLRSFEKACANKAMLSPVSRSLAVSRAARGSLMRSFRNRRMKEFLRIILFGVCTGAEVSKPLSLFVHNLEADIEMENRIRAKTGSSQALTRMGMCLFFPLFTGISTVIVSSSLGMLDESASFLYAEFAAVCAAYVPIILYLSSAFARPDRNAAQNVSSIIPYVCIAAGIGYATQALIGHIV
jgi:hypothetical protein